MMRKDFTPGNELGEKGENKVLDRAT